MADASTPSFAPARIWSRFHLSIFNIVVSVVSVVVVAVVVYPIGRSVIQVFFKSGVPTLAPFRAALDDPLNREAIINTLLIAGIATVFAVAMACLLAWLNERTDAHLPGISRALPILPLLIPPIAASIGWMFLLAPRAGVLNNWIRSILDSVGVHMTTAPLDIFTFPGLIAMYSIFLVPFAYLPISNVLANIDPALEEASRSSGAGLFKTIRKVTLPSALPGILSGMILTAVIALSLFSVPVILGPPSNVEVVSVRVYRMLNRDYPPKRSEAIALSMLMFGIVVIGLILQNRVARRGNYSKLGGRAKSDSRTRLGAWRWPMRMLMLAYVSLTAVLPFFGLVVISLQPYWSKSLKFSRSTLDSYRTVFFDDVNTQHALKNSVLLGLAGATIVVVILTLVTLFAHRNRSIRGRLVSATTKLPAAFPQLIIAIALLIALGPSPFHLQGTLILLLIAYFVLYVPHGSFLVESGFNQLGTDISEASASCGARPGRTFRRIELPLVSPSLISAWSLMFVFMLGDVTASALLTSQNAPVVGFAILNQYENGSFPTIAALGVIMSITSATVVFSAMGLSRVRFSKIGRASDVAMSGPAGGVRIGG